MHYIFPDFVSMFVNQSHSLVEMAMKLVEEFKLIQPVTSEYDSNIISPIEVSEDLLFYGDFLYLFNVIEKLVLNCFFIL